jgi:uncharacterized protein (UPF0305 family)
MDTKHKQRNREKVIEEAAQSFFDKIYDYENNRRDYKGSAYDEGYLDALDQAVETAFIAGAKFADDFPRQGLVEIEDVEDIYMAWLRERECFMDYLKGRCIKAGWI